MAMSVVYTTFAGRIVHEDRAGEQRYYGQDTLGSTAALYDSTGTKTDEYAYWPYGEIRTHTGSSTTPFTFVGTLGYYMDQLAQLYVRARFLMTSLARWLTVDPLWPRESAYAYVAGQTMSLKDPSGLLLGLGDLGLIAKCGAGIVGGILGYIGGSGGKTPTGKDLRNIGMSCLAALVGVAVKVAIVTLCTACSIVGFGCIEGAAAALSNSLLSLMCDPLDPCPSSSNANSTACKIGAAMVDAAAGCLSGVFPSSGLGGIVGQVRSRIWSLVSGLTGGTCDSLKQSGSERGAPSRYPSGIPQWPNPPAYA